MPVDVGAERADEIPFAEVFPILLYVILAIFTRAAEGLYEGIGRTRPDALPWLEQVAVWLTIWAWFHAYARRHRIPLIMDFGWRSRPHRRLRAAHDRGQRGRDPGADDGVAPVTGRVT